MFRYVNVALLELTDGRIQRALGKPLTPDQRRILQGLGRDWAWMRALTCNVIRND
ncbi:hypothetical protein B4113_2598 [Geobacillus sp. B4113_201601]|nr:hypothetical protein B4113_2598 [Geobacillus sp. B4113_201601]